MGKRWLFVLYALMIVGISADDLSDFSNNLATDIGPLLALFGESMTRQYLSESTTFLDYFIFAMAPIGILTAIVSTIRVCGHSSLRAFIGRSQEGDGIVEAELCTSTSRDVCEMFNRGGITRVLGRPNILELVHVPHCGSADKAGLFLFRNYLECHLTEDPSSPWKKVEGTVFGRLFGRWNNQARPATPFAPFPNLSLNVGIVKRPRWVFFAVAAAGFILQGGILTLAGVGVWILQWDLNTDDLASTDYAPIMFIAGTVLMCSGMWACAALIGQTTHEIHYERQPASQQATRLLWLQHGAQLIGDQSFDSFAYLEEYNEQDRIKSWTSSRKDLNEKFELHTLFAVSAVLVGYIMQFIGLRGLKAWISLAQLGSTIIMSILRGFLRMQRLGRSANKLGDMPDLVTGHELDWLAFEIVREEPQQVSFWHVTGHEPASQVETKKTGSTKASQSHDSSDDKVVRLDIDVSSMPTGRLHSPTTSQEDDSGHFGGKNLLPIRARLAHLTGHIPFSENLDGECQEWKDDSVRVREIAGKLSTAVCLAAESLMPKNGSKKDIILRIRAMTSAGTGAADQEAQQISVILRPPSEPSQAGWAIDSARLEAILGLWMWSLIYDERLETEDDAHHRGSLAEKIQRSRIVSAGRDDDSWDDETNRQCEMDLWLGPDAVKLSNATVTIDEREMPRFIKVWRQRTPGDDTGWIPLSKELPKLRPRLFCGWNPAYESSRSRAFNPTDTSTKLRVQFASTRLVNK